MYTKPRDRSESSSCTSLRIELEDVGDERRGRLRVADLRAGSRRPSSSGARSRAGRRCGRRSRRARRDRRSSRDAGPPRGARSFRPALPGARPRAGTCPRRRMRRRREPDGSACSRASFAEVEIGRRVAGVRPRRVLARVAMRPDAALDAISELSFALSARSCARSWPTSSRRTFSRRTATLSATTPASSSAITPIQTTPPATRRRGAVFRTARGFGRARACRAGSGCARAAAARAI